MYDDDEEKRKKRREYCYRTCRRVDATAARSLYSFFFFFLFSSSSSYIYVSFHMCRVSFHTYMYVSFHMCRSLFICVGLFRCGPLMCISNSPKICVSKHLFIYIHESTYISSTPFHLHT